MRYIVALCNENIFGDSMFFPCFMEDRFIDCLRGMNGIEIIEFFFKKKN